MAVDNTKIILGLPALPSDQIPPELYDDFTTVHKAIKSLASGVSVYCGVDAPTAVEWADSPPSDTILTGNLTRMYPIADVLLVAGQLVNLYDSGGVLKARLANATLPATAAHGVCTIGAAAGDRIEMNWLRGYCTVIGGMVLGTIYYTSTTPGAIQTPAPVGVGQIQQPVGIAVSATELILDIPLSFKTN